VYDWKPGEGADQPRVRRHELALLLRCEGNIQAVIDSNSHLGGNVWASPEQREIRMQSRASREYILKKDFAIRNADPPLSLCAGEGVRDFNGKNVRSKKLVD
jgi:hypothetical protein